MSNTTTLSAYELERAATAGAHEIVVADADEAVAPAPKKKVVTAASKGVETA